MGSIEIFTKDTLKNQGKLITRKNNSFPTLHDKELIWAAGSLVFRVDIETPKAQHVGVLPASIAGESVIIDNNLFSASLDGRIFQYDLQSSTTQQLRANDKQVYNLLQIENHLIFSDGTKVYNIEVSL